MSFRYMYLNIFRFQPNSDLFRFRTKKQTLYFDILAAAALHVPKILKYIFLSYSIEITSLSLLDLLFH